MIYPFTSVQKWTYFKGDRLEDALRSLADAVFVLSDDEQSDISHVVVSSPNEDSPFYTAGCIFSWKELLDDQG